MDTTDLTRTALSILTVNAILTAMTQHCVRETRRALSPYIGRPLADLRALAEAYSTAAIAAGAPKPTNPTWLRGEQARAIVRALEGAEKAGVTEVTPELVGYAVAGLVAAAVDADTLLRRPWASEYVPPPAAPAARPACGITCGCAACVAKWAGVPPLERQHAALMSRGWGYMEGE